MLPFQQRWRNSSVKSGISHWDYYWVVGWDVLQTSNPEYRQCRLWAMHHLVAFDSHFIVCSRQCHKLWSLSLIYCCKSIESLHILHIPSKWFGKCSCSELWMMFLCLVLVCGQVCVTLLRGYCNWKEPKWFPHVHLLRRPVRTVIQAWDGNMCCAFLGGR